jgi:hypothetical protein
MDNSTEAGLAETGLGRFPAEEPQENVLDGTTKDGTHGDLYAADLAAHSLASRVAAQVVNAYARRVELDEAAHHELLDMLELPRVFEPPTEAELEREHLLGQLPVVKTIDSRAPNDQLVAERRLFTR